MWGKAGPAGRRLIDERYALGEFERNYAIKATR